MAAEEGQQPLVLTPEEEAALKAYFGSPQEEEKYGLFYFLNKVLKQEDTSKVGNLEENEIEAVRRLQNIRNFSNAVGLKKVGGFFANEAEIVLATSDSKRGFLVTSAISTKRELKTKRTDDKKKGFGWFGSKKQEGEE